MVLLNENIPKRILAWILMLNSTWSSGQEVDYGFSVGLAFSFGTTVNRVGLHAGTFLIYGSVQANLATNGYYNIQPFGSQQKSFEWQLGGGFQLGFGYRDSSANPFIGLTENNMVHQYAAGYNFVQYWDQHGTTQSTGLINLNAGPFNLVTENDLFGNLLQQTDRFRTGAFLIEYQHRMTKVGVNAILWTPDYVHCAIIENEQTEEWARFGYYEDPAVHNRNQTLGIISVQVRHWLPYNQEAIFNVGLNSEKVRNAIQNEFIHDQPFFPDALVKRKPAHIPMITDDNEQFLHKPGQKVRPAQFYFNVGLNTLPFY